MSYTDIIHHWLQAPFEIKEADYRLLKALKKQYPYFHPLYYLDQYLATGKMARRSRPALLYPVNPVLLADWYASAGSDPSAQPGKGAMPFKDADIKDAAAFTPAPASQAPSTPEAIETEVGEADPAGASAGGEQHYENPTDGKGLSGSDYFAAQGIRVDDTLPEPMRTTEKSDWSTGKSGSDEPASDTTGPKEGMANISEERDLMVVMSFSEWLNYLESRSQKAKEEEDSQRAFKARWQQQKLAEALEEETDEIPETVFKMAVSSISREEEPVSETLAEVYIRQGKKAKAMELFEKLSLQNPEKNAYFAQKIARLKKEIDI